MQIDTKKIIFKTFPDKVEDINDRIIDNVYDDCTGQLA